MKICWIFKMVKQIWLNWIIFKLLNHSNILHTPQVLRYEDGRNRRGLIRLKLNFSPYNCKTWWTKPSIYQTSRFWSNRTHSLKYQRNRTSSFMPKLKKTTDTVQYCTYLTLAHFTRLNTVTVQVPIEFKWQIQGCPLWLYTIHYNIGPDNWAEKYPLCGASSQSPLDLDVSTAPARQHIISFLTFFLT